MAINDASKVSVGKPQVTGAIFAAPTTTTLPTDATTTLDKAFTQLGYVSDDGLTNAIDGKAEDINAWGGDTVLTVTKSRSETFEWSFIQSLDKDVLSEVYGASNVSTDTKGVKVMHNGKAMPRRAYVFEMLLTGDVVKRIVVPNGQITALDDVEYTDSDAIAYDVTLSCYPDSSGNTAYEYIAITADDGAGA